MENCELMCDITFHILVAVWAVVRGAEGKSSRTDLSERSSHINETSLVPTEPLLSEPSSGSPIDSLIRDKRDSRALTALSASVNPSKSNKSSWVESLKDASVNVMVVGVIHKFFASKMQSDYIET